ncbi:putative aldo/keto reductase [Candidatus Protochlamydia naegleriophila]|uniref:Putative aldo/keto reductase n=1 Tax=Candidatus Protochlamydia naegleriophila TaxID=389348 RepID=A0A0U5JE91_9BACT|nr:aldo/keto reductase [Candidatus Protochlamydia naegleriophila]CUI16703.1 putative aldo/keto reductase [Candidatus Protochlamydia naegleriophila]
MEKRQLGRSTVYISPIILGTWAIGGWMWGRSKDEDSIEAIQSSLTHGVNTIDTAAIYGMGYSEEIVARAIKNKRQDYIIATKGGMRWSGSEGAEPWVQQDRDGKMVTIRKNSKPASLQKECEDSLMRLGTDVLDLYQIHWPDSTTPIEESWQAMVQLKKQGKVRAIGVSNYNLEQLKIAHSIYPVDSIQLPYSLIRRGIEKNILPYCQKNQIAVIVYSPLERGLLTGKVTPKRQFDHDDHRTTSPLFSLENRERVLELLDRIRPIAARHHATISQLIINCTMYMPGITAIIAGARNASQAIENAEAGYLPLTQQERNEIIEVFAQSSFQQMIPI